MIKITQKQGVSLSNNNNVSNETIISHDIQDDSSVLQLIDYRQSIAEGTQPYLPQFELAAQNEITQQDKIDFQQIESNDVLSHEINVKPHKNHSDILKHFKKHYLKRVGDMF